MRAAWIGLGAMGEPMAGHLATEGHLAFVWNRSEEKARRFVTDLDLGTGPAVAVAESLREAARADVVFFCVSADGDLESVVDRLIPHLRPGQVLVDHSTVAPATARSLAATLDARGVGFLDAPVTGGVEGAENGSLSVMVGGEASVFDRVRFLMTSYARVIHHLGPSGSGQSAKAVNQVMVAGIAEAVCESLALSEKLGLPREAMLELLGGGAAGSWFLDKRGASLLSGRFDKGFHPALLLKDLKICHQVAADAGLDLATLNQALADYESLLARYPDPGRDISALYRIKRGN